MLQTMDFQKARENMIEQQIRTWDVLDQTVLDVLREIPRETFFSEADRLLALADTEIPLGHDQYSFSPKVEARILQSLQIQKTDIILEVGSGCGYLTALLAKLGKQVTSYEFYPDIQSKALASLKQAGVENVTLLPQDALTNLPETESYDVIVLGAALETMIPEYPRALKPGGRLFSFLGTAPVIEAELMEKTSEGRLHAARVFETDIAAMMGVKSEQAFEL